jgi:two-component system cell cycle response regulator
MTAQTSIDIPVKPRVLIADDSRIVRATLIKHIEGMFEFREALDGYGLLQRIRSSRIRRIRDIPVVVVSGSDEREERERAKAAGATDLITKGIDTAQLLSRLDILSKLLTTQREFERSLETPARNNAGDLVLALTPPETLQIQAGALLASAVKNKKNFVMLNIRIGLKHARPGGAVACPPASTIGQLLQRTVRESDHVVKTVVKTGESEFTLATACINSDAALSFAQRVCGAIASANPSKDDEMSFIASCGMVSLSDYGADTASTTLDMIGRIARRRALLGLQHEMSGVIGSEEESALQQVSAG